MGDSTRGIATRGCNFALQRRETAVFTAISGDKRTTTAHMSSSNNHVDNQVKAIILR
jgi:hypothetical protein